MITSQAIRDSLNPYLNVSLFIGGVPLWFPLICAIQLYIQGKEGLLPPFILILSMIIGSRMVFRSLVNDKKITHTVLVTSLQFIFSIIFTLTLTALVIIGELIFLSKGTSVDIILLIIAYVGIMYGFKTLFAYEGKMPPTYGRLIISIAWIVVFFNKDYVILCAVLTYVYNAYYMIYREHCTKNRMSFYYDEKI